MIIDADTHLTPTGEGILVDELIARMDRAGVDKSLVWLQPPYMREINECNEYIYKAVKKYPDRLIGFGWADPNLGVEKAKDMAKKCIEEYGFYGVKLNGAQNSYYIDSEDLAMPVIEVIAKLNSRLAFHIGADFYDFTHPYRASKVAKRFPDLPILIAHMGGAGLPDLSNSAIEFAKECENMLLIGSMINPKAVLKAINELGANRVCYGSDSPFNLMRVEVAKYKALLDGEVSKDETDMVMYKNISSFLGIL